MTSMEVLIKSFNGRNDKNDVLLQELVNAKNWKQALTICERRIKKGEKSDVLLVNKAHVLLNFPEMGRRNQGAFDLHAFLERKPPLTDVDILMYIDKQAEIRQDHDVRFVSMWERAAGGNPDDEELYKRWFMCTFERRDFKIAQKAAMLYQKHFPEKRQPFFMAIVSSHLAATTCMASTIDKRIFGPLACRLLAKAASDTVENLSASRKPARVLESAGDLHLLTTVYQSQGKYKEALEILNDHRIGLLSPIGANSWDLVREKIELCELSYSWEELWQFCQQLLLEAIDANQECRTNGSDRRKTLGFRKFGDDWKVWSAFIDAAASVESNEKSILTKQMIDRYLTCEKVSRHARLALVEYFNNELGGVSSQQEGLLSSCQAYFEHYSSTKVCFQDLHHCIHTLETPRQLTFLNYVSDHAKKISCSVGTVKTDPTLWITSEINALKIDYTLVVSHEDTVTNNMDLLQAFISNCLRLYEITLSLAPKVSASERHSGDDAAILAAMGCIHMHANGNRSALVQSAFILEKLLKHSKHNYDALLIIIRVYLYLGASTRALEHYLKLDIKNIQFQTLGWIMLDRVSVLHPHKSTAKVQGNPSFEPARLLNEATAWMIKSESQIRSSLPKFLENESYINLIDEAANLEKIGNSLTKCNFVCDFSRITRFRYSGGVEISPQVFRKSPLLNFLPEWNMPGPISVDVHDTRDLAAFPNYEAFRQRTFEEYTRSSPTTSVNPWYTWQLRVLELSQILAGQVFTSTPTSSTELFFWIKGEDYVNQISYESDLGIVASGLLSLHSYTSIAVQEQGCKDSGKTLLSDTIVENVKLLVEIHARSYFVDMLDQAKNFAQEPWSKAFTLTEDLSVPHWDFFHICYTLLDMSRLIARTINYVAKINVSTKQLDQKWIDGHAEWCRYQCQEIQVCLQKAARSMQYRLQSTNMIEEIKCVCYGDNGKTDPVGAELRQMVDDGWMQDMSQKLRNSWEEALDGILGMKAE